MENVGACPRRAKARPKPATALAAPAGSSSSGCGPHSPSDETRRLGHTFMRATPPARRLRASRRIHSSNRAGRPRTGCGSIRHGHARRKSEDRGMHAPDGPEGRGLDFKAEAGSERTARNIRSGPRRSGAPAPIARIRPPRVAAPFHVIEHLAGVRSISRPLMVKSRRSTSWHGSVSNLTAPGWRPP
jgi:hypothetical protein